MKFKELIVRYQTIMSGKYIFMQLEKLSNGYRWSPPWDEQGHELPILLFEKGYGLKKPYSNKMSALNAVLKCKWEIDEKKD